MASPQDFRKLLTSSLGLEWSMRRAEGGGYEYLATGHSGHVLDRNKELHNHGVHHNKEKDRYLAASIPPIIQLKWLNEEGWNCLDPENADRLKKKLNDPAWSHLRIWKGQL